jgi:hypothetical protein
VGHARHVGTKRGVSFGRVEALQRRQLGARPLAHRRCPSAHSDRPPANRRWLLRAPRASADSRPVSRPNSVTMRSDSP